MFHTSLDKYADDIMENYKEDVKLGAKPFNIVRTFDTYRVQFRDQDQQREPRTNVAM